MGKVAEKTLDNKVGKDTCCPDLGIKTRVACFLGMYILGKFWRGDSDLICFFRCHSWVRWMHGTRQGWRRPWLQHSPLPFFLHYWLRISFWRVSYSVYNLYRVYFSLEHSFYKGSKARSSRCSIKNEWSPRSQSWARFYLSLSLVSGSRILLFASFFFLCSLLAFYGTLVQWFQVWRNSAVVAAAKSKVPPPPLPQSDRLVQLILHINIYS